jgi:Rho GTPase-activating protein 1
MVYQHYLNLARREDFSQLSPLNIVDVSGRDMQGRPMVVFIGANLPRHKVDMENLLLFLIHLMHNLVTEPYTLVYIHSKNIIPENRPTLHFMKRILNVFPSNYKKNLRAVYVIGYGFWLKTAMKILRPVVSSKFWSKVHHLRDGNDIYKHVAPDQLRVPAALLSVSKPKKQPEVPVFGVSLDEALTRRPSPPGAPAGVPLVIYHCIQHLTDIGALELEGIFRISGSQAIVDTLRKSYDKGEDVDFSLIENPHDVSGLLKLYLRELPEPVIPFDLYPIVIGFLRQSADYKTWKAPCKAVFSRLHPNNRALLEYLIQFLHGVSALQTVNKMSTNNLAIVFGPNLLRPEVETMETLMTENPLIAPFLSFVMMYQIELFL